MIGRIVNGIAAALGAVVFAQFPAFYQQYLQRLGGRLDQAKLDVDRIMEDAATLGRTLEAYVQELLASGTDAARLAAKREMERMENADELAKAYEALSQAGPLERPLAFAQHLDRDLLQETARVFEPAVPVTPEGFVYAGVGILFGLLVQWGCETGGRRVAATINRKTGLRDSEKPQS